MHDQKPRIYFAFPGVGKSTYAMTHAGVIDLDFGNFRAALGFKPQDGGRYYPQFSKLIKYYYNDGFDVLTNDPGLIPLVKQFAEGAIIMELPRDAAALVSRVVEREKKRHVSQTFPKLLAANIEQWLGDWQEVANKYHVPVIHVDYFKEVDT